MRPRARGTSASVNTSITSTNRPQKAIGAMTQATAARRRATPHRPRGPPRRAARPAHPRGEGAAAHRPGLLGHLADREDRAAPDPGLRRPDRRPRRGLGRARPSLNLPSATALGVVLGPRHRPSVRQCRRRRGPSQGRGRRARPDHQPAPLAARRPALRVLQRGPGADRRARRRLRRRRAGERRRRDPEALHRQRLRDRPVHRRRRWSTTAPCASCTCWPSRRRSPRQAPGW